MYKVNIVSNIVDIQKRWIDMVNVPFETYKEADAFMIKSMDETYKAISENVSVESDYLTDLYVFGEIRILGKYGLMEDIKKIVLKITRF